MCVCVCVFVQVEVPVYASKEVEQNILKKNLLLIINKITISMRGGVLVV